VANIKSELDMNLCTGCGACTSICPIHAVSMECVDSGFRYPLIDVSKCTHCGLCVKKCPQLLNNDFITETNDKPLIYAGRIKDESALVNSTSGGAFFALAKSIIEDGGVVFGCAFNEKLDSVHIGINSLNELSHLQGSKYVASDLKNTFFEVRDILKSNKPVLFSGTPCQIAGLRSFLTKDYEKLLTVDIVCHGNPSQKLFSLYILWLAKKWNTKILNYEFRSKRTSSWGAPQKATITTLKGIKIIPAVLDPYFNAFVKGHTFRKSCYQCKYANSSRVGDITLADFWGIARFHPEMMSPKGTSLIWLSTDKGKHFFSKIQDSFYLCKSNVEFATAHNPHLSHPVKPSPIRDQIYAKMNTLDFGTLCRLFLRTENPILYQLEVMKQIFKKSLQRLQMYKDR